ncbi:Preprotein translocase subunit YajC [Candidatus Bealeia paramacronuclearis]|uniref:Sec translocon accessory complex subunit YajC n=1 Tax=Candidatus Bealeia paramacronuclearis TaxID=1921001 RepID=A0ABZ2C715_9PROT|nr:Preprotein translocase subunit YajC [Candidatus Bealeia paramacronuclearis]
MSLSFISDAMAQGAPGAAGGFDFMSLLPLVAIFVVFYFFLIRPQQKKVQQQKDMIGSLRRGDRVITTGGIFGVITKVVSDHELEIEIADGVKVKVARAMVADCVSKGQPLVEKSASSEDKPSVVERATKAATKPKAKPAAKAKAPANKK